MIFLISLNCLSCNQDISAAYCDKHSNAGGFLPRSVRSLIVFVCRFFFRRSLLRLCFLSNDQSVIVLKSSILASFRCIFWKRKIDLFVCQQLWRVSESVFQFRTFGGQFLSCSGDGGNVSAAAELPSDTETFYLERNNDNRVHIRLKTGIFLQV